MNAPVSAEFKRNDRIKIRDDKRNCPKTLDTLLKKQGLTVDHLTGGNLTVLSLHGQTIRIEHPESHKPCVVNAGIFQKAAQT